MFFSLKQKGVIGLIVGFILGGGISKIISSFVNDIVNPLVGLALENVDTLKEASFRFGSVIVICGSFANSLIDFFSVIPRLDRGISAF